jgi:hypothetical protein
MYAESIDLYLLVHQHFLHFLLMLLHYASSFPFALSSFPYRVNIRAGPPEHIPERAVDHQIHHETNVGGGNPSFLSR